MEAVATSLGHCSIVKACEAVAVAPRTYHAWKRSPQAPQPLQGPPRRRTHPRALSEAQKAAALEVLNSPRFADQSASQVHAALLDEGTYLCSERTLYRLLKEAGQNTARHQRPRPPAPKPELLARRPGELWSWDITKLKAATKWTYFHLYVILDAFSRYVVGWMVAYRETAELAHGLIADTCLKQEIRPVVGFAASPNQIKTISRALLTGLCLVFPALLPGALAMDTQSLKRLSLQELMDIQVTSVLGIPQKLLEAPATMVVITSRQIEERGYHDIGDVLRDIKGVDFVRVNGGFPTINAFRGMYGDENRRVLLVVDGIVENNLIGGSELGGPAYSLHNVERVEVLWGPFSALYGANAFGAVIHIVTRKGTDRRGFLYSKGFGSYNTAAENVALAGTLGNFDLSMAGTLFQSDGPRFENLDPRYSASYVDNAYSLFGTVAHTRRASRTMLGFRAFDTPGGLGTLTVSPTGYLGLPPQGQGNTGTLGGMKSDILGEKSSLYESYSRTAYLQNEWSSGSRFSSSARVHLRETGVANRSFAYGMDPRRAPRVMSRNPLAHESRQIGTDLLGTFSLTANQSLHLGLQVTRDDLEKGFRGVNADTVTDTIGRLVFTNLRATFKAREAVVRDNVGGYAQYLLSTKILGMTSFSVGGRYDWNSIYGETINPRLSIVSQPVQGVTTKLLFGTAFRSPSAFELYSKSSTRLSNPDLKPERIAAYEAQILYSPTDVWLFQGSLFRNELTDLIVEGVPVGGGFFRNENSGRATVQGFEAGVDWLPVSFLSVFSNITLQDGDRSEGGEDYSIPNIARRKANAGVTWTPLEELSLTLIANWVGERYVHPSNPLGRVDGYTVTHFAATWRNLFGKDISLNTGVRNLLNREYYDPGIRSSTGVLFPTVHDQPGINVLVKISVRID